MSVGSCNLHITYSDVYLVNCVYRLHGNTKHGFSHKQKRPLTRMTHSEICECVLYTVFLVKKRYRKELSVTLFY